MRQHLLVLKGKEIANYSPVEFWEIGQKVLESRNYFCDFGMVKDFLTKTVEAQTVMRKKINPFYYVRVMVFVQAYT